MIQLRHNGQLLHIRRMRHIQHMRQYRHRVQYVLCETIAGLFILSNILYYKMNKIHKSLME